MRITSPAFADKIPVPIKYTCKGPNQSPPLEFLDVPKETKSMTLVVEDLDSQERCIHWLVYNIPAAVTHFDEDKIPADAMDGLCHSGKTGYAGPCPKNFKGVHRFVFRLYALDSSIKISPGENFSVVTEAMQDHIIAAAELVGVVEGEQISEKVS